MTYQQWPGGSVETFDHRDGQRRMEVFWRPGGDRPLEQDMAFLNAIVERDRPDQIIVHRQGKRTSVAPTLEAAMIGVLPRSGLPVHKDNPLAREAQIMDLLDRNPLRRGYSRATIGHNIAKLRAEGYPADRAAAASYASARRWAPGNVKRQLTRRNPENWHLFMWGAVGGVGGALVQRVLFPLSADDLAACQQGTITPHARRQMTGAAVVAFGVPIAIGVYKRSFGVAVGYLLGQAGTNMLLAGR